MMALKTVCVSPSSSSDAGFQMERRQRIFVDKGKVREEKGKKEAPRKICWQSNTQSYGIGEIQPWWWRDRANRDLSLFWRIWRQRRHTDRQDSEELPPALCRLPRAAQLSCAPSWQISPFPEASPHLELLSLLKLNLEMKRLKLWWVTFPGAARDALQKASQEEPRHTKPAGLIARTKPCRSLGCDFPPFFTKPNEIWLRRNRDITVEQLWKEKLVEMNGTSKDKIIYFF